jgi:hypothetical protein
MQNTARYVVIAVLCAVPIGLLAAWLATLAFDPTGDGVYPGMNRSLGMGPYRAVWFGVAPLIAAAVVGPRVSREDVGNLGGLVRFIGLTHLLAFAGIGVELAVRDPGSLGSFALASPLLLLIPLSGCLIVWLPTGAIWIAAVRRLTVEGLEATTDLERVESERLRNAAAREHVTVDATNLADQGSKLYRNRG